MLGISVDLCKAFDTYILLRKLSVYGIRDIVYSWLCSFLYNRTQCVRIGSVYSSARLVSSYSGVRQGSVLGPLLFLLYVNDIPKLKQNFHCTLFADDTTLACSEANYDNLIGNTNVGLSQFLDWTVAKRLSLNADKTAAILFSNRTKSVTTPRVLCLEGKNIYFLNDLNVLGVKIDHKLIFSLHISSVCSKMSKSIGILSRIWNNVNLSAPIMLYYALIFSYSSLGRCSCCVFDPLNPNHTTKI